MFRNLQRGFSTLFTSAKTTANVLHITDTEGTDSLFHILQNNNIVGLNSNGLYFKSKYNPFLIFGGDATDRGNRDLATTEMLVDFKKRYPKQVFLLAGNREIKNTRFAVELNPKMIHKRLLETRSPYWMSKETKPLDYFIAEIKKQGKSIEITSSKEWLEREIKLLSIQKCQLLYLHWMLENTMGCPNTFRYRRDELTQLRNHTFVTDYEVLESFINENQPTGLMGQYLQLADVGVIIPETGILAVHGGLTKFNIGRIPSMAPQDTPISDAISWIREFNQWFKKQIHHWEKRVEAADTVMTQPGESELDRSVLPIPGKEKFIMTADMLNTERQIVEIPAAVDSYLYQNKIHLVLTGHQPIGDHPCVLRSPHTLFINGDTGYANGIKNPDDTRGDAQHTLEILADKEKANVTIAATLSDKQRITTKLTLSNSVIAGDPNIGKLLSDNRLVQCQLPNGDYRLIQQQGFTVNYSTMSAENLSKLLFQTRRQTP